MAEIFVASESDFPKRVPVRSREVTDRVNTSRSGIARQSRIRLETFLPTRPPTLTPPSIIFGSDTCYGKSSSTSSTTSSATEGIGTQIRRIRRKVWSYSIVYNAPLTYHTSFNPASWNWRIHYSDRYSDDHFEYRHVILPKQLLKMIPKEYFNPDESGTLRLLAEAEWRGIGITQSLGWEHYEVHGLWTICTLFEQSLMTVTAPEPHVLLFRRAKDYVAPTQATSRFKDTRRK